MSFPHKTRLVAKRARLLAPLIALPFAVACGGAEGVDVQGAGHHDGQVVAKQAQVYNIQELAKAIGCGKPKIQVKAADITSGYCNIDKQRYFLSTFPTLEGMRSWANEEQGWGSVLVGNQWVVGVAPESLLPELQAKLGGTIQGEHQMAHDGELTAGHSAGSGH
ncbi:hypothetical protein AB0K60_24155 [Thermopolyspora sp. NPDC052614]|uniref:hypothetical protein n=1 Tax=Thermopolyspora sp. NPDC052614 TaxID=3155682 RepID=UPI003448410F